jgi:hypothetical protein
MHRRGFLGAPTGLLAAMALPLRAQDQEEPREELDLEWQVLRGTDVVHEGVGPVPGQLFLEEADGNYQLLTRWR